MSPLVIDDVERAAWNLDNAQRRRNMAILIARMDGQPVARIAEAASLSRQQVYNILREGEK